MLKIALLGVPNSEKSALAAALADALNTSGWPAAIVLIEKPASAPDLGHHDLVLLMGLMGLDLPSSARHAREASDQQIRAALAEADMAYRVIYGLGEERLHHALQACSSLFRPCPAQPKALAQTGKRASPWAWMCEKCSDPACEHRLLSDLIASRSTSG